MSAEEELRTQLAEKEAALVTLKEKTKAYVQKLQKDHEEALQTERNATQAAVVMHRL